MISKNLIPYSMSVAFNLNQPEHHKRQSFTLMQIKNSMTMVANAIAITGQRKTFTQLMRLINYGKQVLLLAFANHILPPAKLNLFTSFMRSPAAKLQFSLYYLKICNFHC